MTPLVPDPFDRAPEPRPGWVGLVRPGWQHRAAHAAWRHEASGRLLLKLWQPDEDRGAGAGLWQYELVGPGGRRRVALVTFDGDPRPAGRVLELAETAMRAGDDGGPGV